MFRAPSQAGLPPFSLLVKDLPANQRQVAAHLGLTERTLSTYTTLDRAPRPVMLAVFWETRWGRSAADCEAANWGANYYRRAMSLERENRVLREQLAQLESQLTTNAPFFQPGYAGGSANRQNTSWN